MTTAPVSSERTTSSFRTRLGALSLAISGILFALYPALRPFSDETSLQGAEAFASTAWVLAHMLAVVAFILLVLGLLGLRAALQNKAVERLAFLALILNWIGVGLILPYYGAEIFGLRAIGQEALTQRNAALLALADAVRLGPGAVVFVAGLFMLAVSAILVALVVWRSSTQTRWNGLPFALGFVLYLPQFFGSQPIRVAHGLLVALGCILVAVSMVKSQNPRSQLLHRQAIEAEEQTTNKETHQISI